MDQKYSTKKIGKNARYKWIPANQVNQLASDWQYSNVTSQFDLVCFLKKEDK